MTIHTFSTDISLHKIMSLLRLEKTSKFIKSILSLSLWSRFQLFQSQRASAAPLPGGDSWGQLFWEACSIWQGTVVQSICGNPEFACFLWIVQGPSSISESFWTVPLGTKPSLGEHYLFYIIEYYVFIKLFILYKYCQNRLRWQFRHFLILALPH